MRRNQKQSAAIAVSNSAALAPQDAGLPARRDDPVGRPAWVPEDVDFHKVPAAVRQAVAEIIEPAYRQIRCSGFRNRSRAGRGLVHFSAN